MWQADRRYYNTPGYYHLHRDIPLYDVGTGHRFVRMRPSIMVTHIVTGDPYARFPGFSEEWELGAVRILSSDADLAVPRWRQHVPMMVSAQKAADLKQLDPGAPMRPVNAGIRFE